jgi:3-hydroxyisobutyrate dehydrogenase
MRLCSLTLQELTEAMNRGWGDRDSMAYMVLQQERAGIAPIAVPQDAIDAVVKGLSGETNINDSRTT